MPYVTRDTNGNINGIFAREQFQGQEFQEVAEMWLDPRTELTNKLAERGITQEWQMYSACAGMLSLGLLSGKTETQLYAENPGYRNAKDLVTWVEAHKLEHGL